MWEPYALVLLVVSCWYWYDALRARESALAAGQAACQRDQLQFLDDTVAMQSVRPARDGRGRLRLRRRYAFEFSDPRDAGGDNRRDGVVVTLGGKVESVSLEPFRLQ